MSERHSSHPDIVNRLRRTEGHLKAVIAMVEEGRPCVDLAQQLHAIERAISSAKKTLIHDHIDHCLEHSAEKRATIEEFKALAKYL
jgi:uncharacterized protein